MGFDGGHILMDSPTGAYFSGQPVNGRLIFELQKEKKIRGIHLTVRGFCSVHWTSQRSRKIHDRTEFYTIDHSSYEEYISLRLQLVGGKNAERHLNPGKFEYPFSFQLPPNCPSSLEGSVGHVRYEIEAVMDIPFAVDKTLKRDFRVLAPLDLNSMNCKDPGVFEFDQTYCCWCCTSGSSETVVKIPVRGYSASQPIPVEVCCKNRSTVEIEYISFKVKKEIKFRAANEPGQKEDEVTIIEVKKGPVPPHTDRAWELQLDVPESDVHVMETCSYIDVNYYFKVTVSPDGCHTDDDDSCRIYFGTVPLANFQTNAPITDPIPQTNMSPQSYPPVAAPYPQPIINQPLNVNQPYQPHSPYPPNPYPNSSPYPTPNPPHASPYPGGIAPYPLPQNTPYSSPSGPQNPSPYGNPSYPGNNPPIQGSNPPFSPNNPPYPANNPPHPGSNPPYPPEEKSGILGFTMDGQNDAKVPLLPPGTVPYPIGPTGGGSPYIGASAPDATTPDNDLKKPFPIEPNNSPYNPDFMNDKKESPPANK